MTLEKNIHLFIYFLWTQYY